MLDAERDASRVRDVELYELLNPGVVVEWRSCYLDDEHCVFRVCEEPDHTTKGCRDDVEQPCMLETGRYWSEWLPIPAYGDPTDLNPMGQVIAAMREQPVEVRQRFIWALNDICSGEGGTLKPDWVVLALTPEAVRDAAIAALSQAGRE